MLFLLLALAADPAADAVKALGRGVNLGNALDAPKEGEWGFRILPEYFPLIKKAGFAHVRLPVRFSAHAAKEKPFTISPALFRRVDELLDQAEKAGLGVVLNIHHYDEIHKDPDAHRERFLALWRQIAPHYKGRPASVVFEVLNEPNGKLDAMKWNALLADAIPAIRASNPTRLIVVGPASWNNLHHLDRLNLPKDDRLIVTFHYYSPFEFTHQGASWTKGSEKWLGRKWTASEAEVKALAGEMDKAAAWGKKHGRPLYLGEFGAFSKADMDSRARWTRAVREMAEARGMAWAYWEFGSGFGAYDIQTEKWREPLKQALVGKR